MSVATITDVPIEPSRGSMTEIKVRMKESLRAVRMITVKEIQYRSLKYAYKYREYKKDNECDGRSFDICRYPFVNIEV